MDNRRVVKTVTGFLVLSFSLAALFITAKNGSVPKAVALAFTSWLGYILIHWSETGQIIDKPKKERKLPESERSWTALVVSAMLFALGMAFGSYGVFSEHLLIASTGAGTLLIGYFIAHLQFSDHVV